MNFRKKQDKVQIEIDNLIDRLVTTDPADPEYETIADNLDKLIQIRNTVKSKNGGISNETILKVGAIILELMLVLNYEKVNVITTKAWTLLPKVKL